MGKRLESTPRSKVRAALRQLFLRSRERASAVKRDLNACVKCGKKRKTQTQIVIVKGKPKKKVVVIQPIQVHHKAIGGIGNWDKIIDAIFEELLCHPDMLETMCPECHRLEEKTREEENADEKVA